MFRFTSFFSFSSNGRCALVVALILATTTFASILPTLTQLSSPLPTATATAPATSPPLFHRVSSKPAKDIPPTHLKKNIWGKILLTLAGLGMGPLFLLSIFSLMFALSTPPLWLFALLNLLWIAGFGVFYAVVWRIRQKPRKWLAILLASLSAATFTTIVMWLTEYLYFGVFLSVFWQVMLALLAAGIVMGLIGLGVRWMRRERENSPQ